MSEAPTENLSDDAPLSTVEAETLFEPLSGETRLLAAISGGPDSVALLALLAAWAGRGMQSGRPAIHAATVDHGLRAAAAEEALAVGRFCASLGVPHSILRWQAEKPRSGLQEKARAARYGLLAEQARALGGAVIVTAHTLDDQAETLLMRMAKGSGPAGLAGMRARALTHGAALARPLLGVAKARLVATCKTRGLAFVEDPSNCDPQFARARWRDLMPLLAQEGLTAARLGRLAERIARAEQALDQRAATLLSALLTRGEGDERRLDFAALCREPDEIVIRVLGRALLAAQIGEGGPDGALRLERLEAAALALAGAARAGAGMRRTLGGFDLSLAHDGVLRLAAEAVRRRGVHPAMG